MDTALKQRLIGAIVLVALAVIFLPMLVKGPAPDSGVSDVPLQAPAAPADGQFETRELPLVTPGNAPAGGAVGMGNGAPAPVGDAPAAAQAASQDATALPPSAAAGDYAVSFGAYASEADAQAVIARLQQARLPGFVQKAEINGRPAWRVRIGPYAEQAQAEAVRLQAVKVRNDVNAQVVTLDADAAAPATPPAPVSSSVAAQPAAPARVEPLPPAPAKPAAPAPKPAAPAVAAPAPKPQAAAKPVTPVAPTAPAARSVGFAVQLGAFGSAEDANALRDKVRGAGFSAFVEQVRTDKGTLHRVRVGPVANRSDAEQLKAQVAAKVGISGMVRPHP